MRVNQQDIVPDISAEQVDQANRSWDALGHMRLLVSCSLALVSYTNEIAGEKKKDCPSELAKS